MELRKSVGQKNGKRMESRIEKMRKLEDWEVQHLSHVFCSPESEHRIHRGVSRHSNTSALPPHSRTGRHGFLDFKGPPNGQHSGWTSTPNKAHQYGIFWTKRKFFTLPERNYRSPLTAGIGMALNLTGTVESRRQWDSTFTVLKENYFQPRIL